MLTLLAGYRTYLIVLVLVIAYLVEGVLGIDVPGVEVHGDLFQNILLALGLGTLRAGLGR